MAIYTSPSEAERNYEAATGLAFFGIFVGGVIGFLISLAVIDVILYIANYQPIDWFRYVGAGGGNADKLINFIKTKGIYETTFSTIIEYFSIFFAVIFAPLFFWLGAQKQSAEKIVKGVQAISDPIEARKSATKLMKKACEKAKPGVFIYPPSKKNPDGIRIPMGSESLHFFYSGKTGAGKTVSLQWVLRSAVQRPGDLVALYDFKGDFTEMFSDKIADGTAVLLAPWDTRSMRWDINADMHRVTDAGQIAASLIPSDPNAESFWTDSSRDIMTAVLTALRYEVPGGWSFKHLSWLFSNSEALSLAICKYRPNAAIHIKGDSDQSQGVLSSIRTAGSNYDILAKMWGDENDNRGFSLTKWANREAHKKVKMVIISGNPNYDKIYNNCISSMFSTLLQEISGMKESRNRRIWCFLDELGQLGDAKIESLHKALTVGRSKGLRCVIGIQDVGALQTMYGDKLTETISGQAGTFFGGLQSGENAKWSSAQFGTQTVERYSQTLQPGNNQSIISGQSASSTWQKNEQPAVSDGEFNALPASETNGGPTLWAKIAGVNNKAFCLHFPYIATPKTGPAVIERTDYDDLPLAPPDAEYTEPESATTEQDQGQKLTNENHTNTTDESMKNIKDDSMNVATDEQQSFINDAQNSDTLAVNNTEEQQGTDENDLASEAMSEALAGIDTLHDAVEIMDTIFDDKSVESHTVTTASSGGGKRKKRTK